MSVDRAFRDSSHQDTVQSSVIEVLAIIGSTVSARTYLLNAAVAASPRMFAFLEWSIRELDADIQLYLSVRSSAMVKSAPTFERLLHF